METEEIIVLTNIEVLQNKYKNAKPKIDQAFKDIRDEVVETLNALLEESVEAGVDVVYLSHAKIENIAGGISRPTLRIFNKHNAVIIENIIKELTESGFNVTNKDGVLTVRIFNEYN